MKVWDSSKPAHCRLKYVHVKRDGYLIKIVRPSLTDELIYLTKNYNQKDLSFLSIHQRLLKCMPPGTELYCELWKPGEPAAAVSTGIAQRDPRLILEAFAVGNGLPTKVGLGVTAVEVRRWGMDFIPFFLVDGRDEDEYTEQDFSLCSGMIGLVHDDPLMALYDNLAEPGRCEGFVLKNYQGNSTDNHFKWKPFLTADLKIRSVTLGKGKFAGMIGSLVVEDANNRVVANVSGMDNAMRQQLTDMIGAAGSAGSLIGRIVEVKYQYINTQGKLRHPVFLRLRDDKDHADAIRIQ